jgi:hypothetical protein
MTNLISPKRNGVNFRLTGKTNRRTGRMTHPKVIEFMQSAFVFLFKQFFIDFFTR